MTVGRKCHTGIRQRMPDRNFIQKTKIRYTDITYNYDFLQEDLK